VYTATLDAEANIFSVFNVTNLRFLPHSTTEHHGMHAFRQQSGLDHYQSFWDQVIVDKAGLRLIHVPVFIILLRVL